MKRARDRRSLRPRLRTLRWMAAAAGATALLQAPARATWSIVAVRPETGEVCIAGATCISNINLLATLGVIVPGQGVAAAQSLIDTSGNNRLRIRDGILAGDTPEEILALLASVDNQHERRQYGIVTVDAPPVTFTGSLAGEAKLGVTGEVDGIVYAIQGNVLAGDAVVLAAEDAFVHTHRDLAQRAMAAMEAARRFGGDGRCSCDPVMPTSCGSPPPDFDKSAHAAFIALARVGDTLGDCDGTDGCANGDYYLRLGVVSAVNLTDPVMRLERRFLRWRLDHRGLPDHVESRVTVGAPRLVADGATSTEITIALADLDGTPLDHGGQTVQVVDTTSSAPVALAGPVTDHGDGTHSFPLVATTNPGSGSFDVVVTEGTTTVQLFPPLRIEVDPLAELHAGFDTVSAAAAPSVPLVLNAPADAGLGYNLIGSASGTSPGIVLGGVAVPLNRDRLFQLTFGVPGWRALPGTTGVLDAAGRAEARLELPSSALATFAGRRLDFVGLLAGTPGRVTNLVGFTVVP